MSTPMFPLPKNIFKNMQRGFFFKSLKTFAHKSFYETVFNFTIDLQVSKERILKDILKL